MARATWKRRAAQVAIVLLTAAAAPAEPGEWVKVFAVGKGELGARSYCKPVLLPDGRLLFWGSPGKDSARDWTTAVYDLAANRWTPLPPTDKPEWLKRRPKMRYAMRWGLGTRIDANTAQPVPVCYFNQAAYVPSLKKVLYLVGDKTLLFDPATGRWESLACEPAPPLVLWSALTYDPVNDEVVLFGGGARCEANRPGTWLFSAKSKTWRKLDQPLDQQPPPRCNAPTAYDSRNKLIAVFGGDAQDRYLSDTWVYDCTERRWRELKTNVRPFPRSLPVLCYLEKQGVFMMAGPVPGVPWPPGFSHRRRKDVGGGTWVLDAKAGTWTKVAGEFPGGYWCSAVYDAKRDRAVLHRTTSRYASASQLQVWSWKPDLTSAGEGATAPPEPVYKYHPPEWYTKGGGVGPKLPPVDPKAGEKLLAALKPNEWVAVKPPRDAYGRTWGSVTLDTDRHELILWGGGHCGYCGTDVSHLSLKTLRWTSSFPPEFPPAPASPFYGDESSFHIACRTFRGRPWVQHGRVSYAYDPVSKTVAFTETICKVPTRAWTYIYDVARREFVDVIAQPTIAGYSISNLLVSTPHGVYMYKPRGETKYQGLYHLDVKARKWTCLDAKKATAPARERNRMVHDSKRGRLVLVTNRRRGRAEKPAMYAWDLKGKTTDWVELPLTGEPPAALYRESVYIEKHDRILHLPQTARGKKGVVYACDLAGGNKWTHTGIALPTGVGPSTGLAYDPALDVLLLTQSPGRGPCGVWVMRYAPPKEPNE